MSDFGIRADGPHMFSVSGELDIATVPLMNVAIAHAVSQGGPITIDMSFLTFMDSTGVGAILKSAKEMAAAPQPGKLPAMILGSLSRTRLASWEIPPRRCGL